MTVYTCKILNSLPHVVSEGDLDNLNSDFVTGDFTPGTVYSSMALQPDTGLGTTLFINSIAPTTQLNVFGAPTSYVVDEWVGVELDTGEWFWSLIESVNNAGGVITLRDPIPSDASAGAQVVATHEAQGATLWTTVEDFKYPKGLTITDNTAFLRTAEIPYNNYLFNPSDQLIADIGAYLASTRAATNFNVTDTTGREYAFQNENDLADFTYLISGYIDNLLTGQGTLLQQVWVAANTQVAMDAIVDNRTSTVPSLTELGFPFVRYNDNTENGITITSPGAISGASIRLNNSSDIPRVVLSYSEDTDTALFSSIVDATLGSSSDLTVVGDTILLSSNEANNEAVKFESDTGGDASLFVVNATPEGTTTGNPGDLAVDTAGGMLYVKRSGAATNTGWQSTAGSLGAASIQRLDSDGADSLNIGTSIVTFPSWTTDNVETGGLDADQANNRIRVDQTFDTANGDLYEISFFSNAAIQNARTLTVRVVYDHNSVTTATNITIEEDGLGDEHNVAASGLIRLPTTVASGLPADIYVDAVASLANTSVDIYTSQLVVKRIG